MKVRLLEGGKRVGLILVLAWLLVALVAPLIIAQQQEVITIYPIEDAYVVNENPDTNYGSSTTLVAGWPNYDMAYLKFSIPELNSSRIAGVKLKIYIISTPTSDYTLQVSTTSNEWSEDTLTYNNKPSVGSQIATAQGTTQANVWIEFDITSYVINNCLGKVCSLVISHTASAGTYYQFASKEYDNPAYHPRIEILLSSEVITQTVTETVYVTTETENVTITETTTTTNTITETATTTVTDYVTETQTTTVTQTDTVYTTETAYTTSTATTTHTITDVITETATTTITQIETAWANQTVTITTTITPTTTVTVYGNETVTMTEYGNSTAPEINYQALADALMPIVLIVGVISTLLGLLLQSTNFRRGD